MVINSEALAYIKHFNMQSHPEGGFYVQVYKSESLVKRCDNKFNGCCKSSSITSIYFLLTTGQISKFHRLKSDEIWYFHAGSALAIHIINPNGEYLTKYLGPNITSNENYQLTIKAGQWFGAQAMAPNSFAFVSCAVAPGFTFDEFELASRDNLTSKFPQHSTIIEQFT